MNRGVQLRVIAKHVYMYIYIIYISVFLISLYGAPLAQTASYLALHSSLWASGAVNYDYIVTNSINSLLIGSRSIPNGAHTNLAHASKSIKNSALYIYFGLYNVDGVYIIVI